jgi:hypothetical protein
MYWTPFGYMMLRFLIVATPFFIYEDKAVVREQYGDTLSFAQFFSCYFLT